jgi:hypothetical protein
MKCWFGDGYGPRTAGRGHFRYVLIEGECANLGESLVCWVAILLIQCLHGPERDKRRPSFRNILDGLKKSASYLIVMDDYVLSGHTRHWSWRLLRHLAVFRTQ